MKAKRLLCARCEYVRYHTLPLKPYAVCNDCEADEAALSPLPPSTPNQKEKGL